MRTPLARRIEEDEFLGSVALFLPHYDEDGLKTGRPGHWFARQGCKDNLALYRRAPDRADLFDILAKVPTYVLDNTRRQANTRRLLSLSAVKLSSWVFSIQQVLLPDHFHPHS